MFILIINDLETHTFLQAFERLKERNITSKSYKANLIENNDSAHFL